MKNQEYVISNNGCMVSHLFITIELATENSKGSRSCVRNENLVCKYFRLHELEL